MIPLIFTLDIFMVSWTFYLTFDFFLQKGVYIINIGRYFRKGCVNPEEREESGRERMSCHLTLECQEF